jgi:hypothetical protein
MWNLYGLLFGVVGAIMLVCGVAFLMVSVSKTTGRPSLNALNNPRDAAISRGLGSR